MKEKQEAEENFSKKVTHRHTHTQTHRQTKPNLLKIAKYGYGATLKYFFCHPSINIADLIASKNCSTF